MFSMFSWGDYGVFVVSCLSLLLNSFFPVGLSTRDVHQSIWSEIGEALGHPNSEKCLRMSAEGYRWNTTPCDSQTFFVFEKGNNLRLVPVLVRLQIKVL